MNQQDQFIMDETKNISKFNKQLITAAVLMELTVSSSLAATINVNDNNCSLSDAINAANTNAVVKGCDSGEPGMDTIVLPLNALINNFQELPLINSDVTIEGQNTQLNLFNNHAIRADGFGNSNASLTINNLNLNYDGVDVQYTSNLTVNNVTFNNITGEAINAFDTEMVEIDTVLINSTSGRGILALGEYLTISNSQILNTSNDAINFSSFGADGANFSAINTLIHGGDGRGISIQQTDMILIDSSTISGKNSDRQGAGIYIKGLFYSPTSNLTIVNTTISGNYTNFSPTSELNASGGAGIFFEIGASNNQLNIIGSTITNNSTTGDGGGVRVFDRYNMSATPIIIQNSILAGNQADGFGAEMYIPNNDAQLGAYNIIGINGQAGAQSAGGNNILIGASDSTPDVAIEDLIQTELATNNGITPTHALAFDSPALDFIPAAFCETNIDQRGVTRPFDGNNDLSADCDVGAYEQSFVDLIFKNQFETP